MINIHLSRAEALHIIELLNKAHDSLTQSLLIAVEDENAKDEVVRAAKLNYVSNLETEVGRLSKEVDKLRKPEAKKPKKPTKQSNGPTVWKIVCDSVKHMKMGDTIQLKTPEWTTFEKFRMGVSATLSQKHPQQFTTSGHKEEKSVFIQKIKEAA